MKTSRWMVESSNHPKMSGPSPDAIENSAQKTPNPITRWCGRTRDLIRARSYSSPELQLNSCVLASPMRAVHARSTPERRRVSAEGLLVEVTHHLRERG